MSTEFIHTPSFIVEEYSPASLGQISLEQEVKLSQDREAILSRSHDHYQFYDDTLRNIRAYLTVEYAGDVMHNPNLVYGSYSRKQNKMTYKNTGMWEYISDDTQNYLPHSRELVIRDQFLDLNFHIIQGTHWVEGRQYRTLQSGEVVPLGEFIDGLSGPETVIHFETHIWHEGQYVPVDTVFSDTLAPMEVIFSETLPSA